MSPLFNPHAAVNEYRFLDLPPPLPATLHFETEVPDSYALTRGGLFVETESAVRFQRGEILTTSTGDYVQTIERVITADASYEIEVTSVDVGAGSQALQTVVTETLPPEYEPEPEPVVETETAGDPYVPSETGSVAVVGEVSGEVQQQGDLNTTQTVDPSTYQYFGFDQSAPPPVDESLYQYFGYSTGDSEPIAVTPPTDPALQNPDAFL